MIARVRQFSLRRRMDRLKLIEEEFDIDYELAAKVIDTEDQLRKELVVKVKIISTMEKKKEISDQVIKTLQTENETLVNNFASVNTDNERFKQELKLISSKSEKITYRNEIPTEDEKIAFKVSRMKLKS